MNLTVPNINGLNWTKKNTKYQEPKNDLRISWSLKEIDIIPVVLVAKRILKKNLQDYLKN